MNDFFVAFDKFQKIIWLINLFKTHFFNCKLAT